MIRKSGVDYKSKQRIVFAFNQSVSGYSEYKRKIQNNSNEYVRSLLNDAGTKLYQSYEWALKNHLYSAYGKKHKKGEWKWKEYNLSIKILSEDRSLPKNQRVNCNQKYLFDEMSNFAMPSILTTDINFELIKNNAFSVNNCVKHLAQNVVAEKYEKALNEIRKVILTYVDNDAELETLSNGCYATRCSFYELLEKCNDFEEDSRWNYVLITDKLNKLNQDQMRAMTYIKWSLIFDFDEDSDEEGLSNAYLKEHNVQAFRFNIKNPEKTNFNLMVKTPYWFFVNGVNDLPDSVVNEDKRKWTQKYSSKMYSILEKYHSVFTNPIKVIILSNQVEKVKDIVTNIDALYQENSKFYILNNNAKYSEFIDEFECEILPLDTSSFATGIINNATSFSKQSYRMDYKMPGKNGQFPIVRLENFSHFELLYKGIADSEDGDSNKTDKELFYQGRVPLSWYGAKYGFAVNRSSLYSLVKKEITQEEYAKSKYIIRIVHEPGIGGSTFTRELAYHVSKEMPVAVLRMYKEEETASQLANLYNICKLSILVLVESSILTNEQVSKFTGELKAASFPFVIVYAKRKSIFNDDANNVYKLNYLDDDECNNMYEILKPYSTKEKTDEILKEIVESSKRKNEKSPFFMALYTFEDNFFGITPYIAQFIKNLKEEQKNILLYISIADYYANRPIDVNFFGTPLIEEDDESTKSVFNDDGVFENLITTVNVGDMKYYKIRHPLFAKEIISQLIAKEDDNKEVFANKLINHLIDFIRYSKSNDVVDYDSSLDVLKNLFILKDSNEIVNDRFAPLISKIKGMLPVNDNGNGIGLIFKMLVDVYPNEPHFIAHLARFCAHVELNYDKGIEWAGKAIELSEELGVRDALLYHIKGISLRKKIKDYYIKKIKQEYELDSCDGLIEEMRYVLDDASEMFKISRDINNKVAGYISDIEMCIDIIDLGKLISGDLSTEEFINKFKDSWYITYLDRALSLMEDLKSVRNDDDDEFEEFRAQHKIFDMLDSIEKTITMWDEYLVNAKQSEKPQIRRFLARAIEQQKYKEDCNYISNEDIDTVIELMENNIKEEPNNPANIRIWFNAIRYSNSKEPSILLDEAIQNLNLWKISTGSIEAYYYYFILVCIKAIEGSSRAEAEIPSLQIELKQKSSKMPNNRIIYEWLGVGRGIARLISTQHFKNGRWQKRKLDIDSLGILKGRISEDYRNAGNAYIISQNMKVFFNPSNQVRKVLEEDTGKKVRFSIGFSYDGLRSFNNSVEVIEDDYDNNIDLEWISEINTGKLVRCKVLKNVDHFVKVKLLDYKEEFGSIHIDNLSNEFTNKRRPLPNSIIHAYVMHKVFDNSAEKEIWKLCINENYRENKWADEQEWKKNLEKFKKERL